MKKSRSPGGSAPRARNKDRPKQGRERIYRDRVALGASIAALVLIVLKILEEVIHLFHG